MTAKRWMAPLAIAALALVSSLPSVTNGFAYDDNPIVAHDARIRVLGSIPHRFVESYWPPDQGGALYRPITMAAYTIQWAIGQGSPLPFHMANIVLYLAVCVAVYALARQVLPDGPAAGAAALFAVHPVHVEVVANVVGQAELIAALAVVVGVAWYLRRRSIGVIRARDIALLAVLYAVGVLAKEHAIMLPALLLLAELTVLREPRPSARLRLLGLVLTLVAVLCIAARAIALPSSLGDYPAMAWRDASWTTRFWTMLGVVGQWVRLLVWPAHLSAVYSPPGTPVRSAFDIVAFSGALVLAAAIALAVAARRKLPIVSFGLGWIAVVLLPVSNLLIPTGLLLAERTLFLSSVGIVLAVAALAPVIRERWPAPPVLRWSILGALVIAGTWRSATRAPVWQSDETVFASAVEDEPLSYAAHYGYASVLFRHGVRGQGEREARTALRLYQNDPRVFVSLASEYVDIGACEPADAYARRALELMPSYTTARVILGRCLLQRQSFDSLRTVALAGLSQGYHQALFRRMLFTADSGIRVHP